MAVRATVFRLRPDPSDELGGGLEDELTRDPSFTRDTLLS
jgi:hypothetical protein